MYDDTCQNMPETNKTVFHMWWFLTEAAAATNVAAVVVCLFCCFSGEPGERGESGSQTGGQHDPTGRQPAPDQGGDGEPESRSWRHSAQKRYRNPNKTRGNYICLTTQEVVRYLSETGVTMTSDVQCFSCVSAVKWSNSLSCMDLLTVVPAVLKWQRLQ